jgi:hypothetical protein
MIEVRDCTELRRLWSCGFGVKAYVSTLGVCV